MSTDNYVKLFRYYQKALLPDQTKVVFHCVDIMDAIFYKLISYWIKSGKAAELSLELVAYLP